MSDKEFILDWIRRAADGLFVARELFDKASPKQSERATFYSQQCAEKALKAFLVYNNIALPRTGNLKNLYELCQNIDTSFVEVKADCEWLAPYNSKILYPNKLVVDEIIARMALEDAQRVYDFCTAKINLQCP